MTNRTVADASTEQEREARGSSIEHDRPTDAPWESRVLVADDNADMREYLTRLLSPLYTVEAVSNGAEALQAAIERPPDLVLTDAMMPELDGVGLVRALRDDPRTRLLPVVMLSALTGEESAVKGLEEGADDYLVKPFSAQELLARVRTRLEGSHLRKQELRRRQQESDRFFDLSLDLMAIASFDGYLKRFNPAYERILGWSEQELLTRPYFDIIHPDDREQLTVLLESLGAGQQTMTYEVRLLCKQGGHRWVRASAKPIPEEGLIYAVGLDITERKQAEELLSQREAQLAEAQRIARLGSWEWDIAADAVKWSKELYQLFGLEPQDTPMSYQQYLERLAPEDRTMVAKAVAQALEDGSSFSFERKISTGERERTIHSLGHVIVDASGEPLRIVGTVQDVTELRRGEEARARLAAVVDSSVDAIMSCTLDGTITSWNSSAERLLGWSAEEVMGRSIATVALACEEKEQGRMLEVIMRGESVGRRETKCRRKDGRSIEVSIALSAVVQGGIHCGRLRNPARYNRTKARSAGACGKRGEVSNPGQRRPGGNFRS